MKRTLVGRYIDNVAITLIVTLCSFAFLTEFIKNGLICLLLGALIGFITISVVIFFQNKRLDRLSIKSSELKDVERLNHFLRSQTDKELKELFMSFLPYTLSRSGVLVKDSLAIALMLERDRLEKQDIYDVIRRTKNVKNLDQVVVICNDISPEASKLAAALTPAFHIYLPIETYALFKKYDKLPAHENLPQTKKRFFKPKISFLRSSAKQFIKLGLLLYFMAIFVPFTKYYIIAASVSLMVAAVLLLFGSSAAGPKKAELVL